MSGPKKKKSCCLDPLFSQDIAARGELIDPILQPALCAVLRPPLSAPRPQGVDVVCCESGRLLSGCLSSTKSVGLFERSRSTGCISPASAKCLAPRAWWRRTGERENETVGARQGSGSQEEQSLVGETGRRSPWWPCLLPFAGESKRPPPNTPVYPLPLHDTPEGTLR